MKNMARIDRHFITAGGLMLLVGVVLLALGMGKASQGQIAHSAFFGVNFWFCLAIGCFALSLLHHCARGHWGFPVIRLFEAGGGPQAIALLGIAEVALFAVFRTKFFPWMDPETVAHDAVLQAKSAYLNEPFFWGRAAFYLAAFVAVGFANRQWLRNEERTGDDKWRAMRTNLSSGFLPVFVLLANFMFTDWIMSQEPHWYSTIFGVWFLVGGALSALALCAMVLGFNAKKAPYDQVVNPTLTKDIGNLMLAFTMLWAYFSFSQYLITWSGNLPEFTVYFAKRAHGNWWLLGSVLVVLHFFVPFTLLLSPRSKRVPMVFGAIGVYILLMRICDQAFVILPAWRPVMSWHVLDIGWFMLAGGIWCLQFGATLRTAPLVTYRTPELKEAAAHA